jgi:hypothetical protein
MKLTKVYRIQILLFSLSCLMIRTGQAQVLESSNLPIVIFDTQGRGIVNEPKTLVKVGIIDNGLGKRNKVTDPQNDYKGLAGVEFRGSTSQDLFPKKPYGIELWDSTKTSITRKILGFPTESDWILNPLYNDKTLMRDPVAYWLARQTGRYASRTKHVELIVDGRYEGIYILQEKIKRDVSRVDIEKLALTDNTGDALTGGYIVKIDKETGSGIAKKWNSNYRPDDRSQARPLFQVDHPKAIELSSNQFEYIKAYVNAFEQNLFGPNFADPTNGYAKYIDVNSFVDFFLLNEITKNVDGFRLSTYFYKNRDSKGGKLTMGPAWDFNIALGNGDYYEGYKPQGWQYKVNDRMYPIPAGGYDDVFKTPAWWGRLLDDFSFAQKTYTRWKSLRNNQWSDAKLNGFIDSTATAITESQSRNFQRWPVLGKYVWPNYYIGKTHQDEVSWMKSWMAQRVAWIDGQLKEIGVLTATEQLAEGRILKVYPNPIENQTNLSYDVPQKGKVLLQVYDLMGRPVQTLVNETQPAGTYQIAWQTQSISQGIYILDFQLDDYSVVKKKIVKH